MSLEDYARRVTLADLTLINQGITFAVYGDEKGAEKPFPFDLIPRIIPADEWEHIERGLKQRLTALNMFLHDVYHDQKIANDNVIPRELIVGAANFRREFMGADPPGGIYVHICGTDLIRDGDGTYRVLEDNLRTPSGVSYVLENRNILTRILPSLFRDLPVRPVDHYTTQLLHNLRELAPEERGTRRPSCCSRPASTTARILNTPFSRSSWAWNWWRGATCSWTTTSCT